MERVVREVGRITVAERTRAKSMAAMEMAALRPTRRMALNVRSLPVSTLSSPLRNNVTAVVYAPPAEYPAPVPGITPVKIV